MTDEIIMKTAFANEMGKAQLSRELGQTQDDLEQQSYINQLIIDSVNDGIFTIDRNGDVLIWNKAAEEMTGYCQEEIDHKFLHDLIHHTNAKGEKCLKEECIITKSLYSGTTVSIENDIFWRKNGTSFAVEYTTSPIRKDNEYVGLVVTFRDTTKKIETEKLLRESEKLSAVGEFAAGIAHEIRNPLTALKGFLHLIQLEMNTKEDYFQIMNSEFNRIEQILKELLLLAKPQSASLERIPIGQLMRNVIVLLETQSIMKNISIRLKLPSEPVYLCCVENQIKQVFINIIKNAIEAMDDSGEIVVKVQVTDEKVFISVTDQGCGIPLHKLKKIKEPFYTTKETGTGLGLLVTYNIVEDHKGEIEIESTEGKGTTFTIKLPLDRD